MSFPTSLLADHHGHCDDLFVVAEESAQRGDWPAATAAFEHFRDQMQAHFEAEESLLFPAFEASTGMQQGPTEMMRHEHEQMRTLLSQLAAACEAQESATYAGVAETLLMLMQQHNMKEENILYPMCDQELAAEADDLGAKMRAVLEEDGA